MRDVIYLAWMYLLYHRFKTAVLAGSIALITYLPIGLNIVVNRSSQHLTARAQATPLLIGAKGSSLELTLRTLYFDTDVPSDIRYSEAIRVRDSNLALAIPIHARYRTRHCPIVGTTLEYFEYRNLQLVDGRQFGMLGECILGATAAKRAGVETGDSVLSSGGTVFDLAGEYPLKMKVVGVLRPAGTPDDEAVFVDVKTAWVIAGLGHGHDDLTEQPESGAVRKEDNRITADASVVQFTEITKENIASFHFHGDEADFPITSVIAVPDDHESATVLQGRYVNSEEQVQIVIPSVVMDNLLRTVLTVRRYLLFTVGVVALATLASMTLVFLLSWQLRRREMETILRIGGSRSRVASLVAAEVVSVIVAGVICAGVLAAGTSWLADSATRLLIQMS